MRSTRTHTPLDTSIASMPANPSDSTIATFAFTSTASTATFECQLDGVAFVPCVSPTSYANLAVGSHTFAVRATDAAGNVDVTPATFTLANTTSS